MSAAALAAEAKAEQVIEVDEIYFRP